MGWNISDKHKFKTPQLVDESHPAAKLLPKTAAFPRFLNAHIKIRAFPKAVLRMPDVSWPNPPYDYLVNLKWSEHLEALQETAEEGEVGDVNTDLPELKIDKKIDFINMSVGFASGKRTVHKSAVVRNKIARKLKTAISLIVTRGADVDHISDVFVGLNESRLILNNDVNIDPHQWILPGTLHIRSSHPSKPTLFYQAGHMYSLLPCQSTACHTRSWSPCCGKASAQFIPR